MTKVSLTRDQVRLNSQVFLTALRHKYATLQKWAKLAVSAECEFSHTDKYYKLLSAFLEASHNRYLGSDAVCNDNTPRWITYTKV